MILSELARDRPERALYQFNLGNANFMQGRYTEARIAYEKALSLGGPLAVPAAAYVAKCQLRAGDADAARVSLAEAARTAATASERKIVERVRREVSSRFARERLRSAIVLYRNQDYQASGDEIERSLELEESTEARLLLGLVRAREGDIELARDELTRTIDRAEYGLGLHAEASALLEDLEAAQPRFQGVVGAAARVDLWAPWESEPSLLVFSSADYEVARARGFALSASHEGQYENASYFTHWLSGAGSFRSGEWGLSLAPGASVQHGSGEERISAGISVASFRAIGAMRVSLQGDALIGAAPLRQARLTLADRAGAPGWSLGMVATDETRADGAGAQWFGPELAANVALDEAWRLSVGGGAYLKRDAGRAEHHWFGRLGLSRRLVAGTRAFTSAGLLANRGLGHSASPYSDYRQLTISGGISWKTP